MWKEVKFLTSLNKRLSLEHLYFIVIYSLRQSFESLQRVTCVNEYNLLYNGMI